MKKGGDNTMPDYDDYLHAMDDPEPLDENDPETKEEMFSLHKYLGDKPEDLPGMTEEQRKEYAEWLEKNKG
jgi:hypothetical protein